MNGRRDYDTDADRLTALEVALIGYDGRNGIRGQVTTLAKKHDELADAMQKQHDDITLSMNDRFDKLFSRLWWILGGFIGGAFVIAGAIISAH